MAVTQADIDNLNAAIAGGEKIVRIGDKWVEYHSIEQLIKARDDLRRELAALNVAAGQKQRPRVVYHTQKSRGY